MFPYNNNNNRKKRKFAFDDEYNFRADFVQPLEENWKIEPKEEEEEDNNNNGWPASFQALIEDSPIREARKWWKGDA